MRSWAVSLSLLLGVSLAACSDDAGSFASGDSQDADGGDEGGEAPRWVELEPDRYLLRLSMALRGKRPSAAELERVREDPSEATFAAIVDDYLDSPEFGEVIRDLHNDALLLRAEYLNFPAGFLPKPPLTGVDIYALNQDVMQAPLRLIEHIVANDRPYTEIVTADYTLANASVAAVWGLPHSGDNSSDGGWEETSWGDGREAAGVLSDPWLYQRHGSTPANANRGRASLVARALLCHDFLDRDIDVDTTVDLGDPAAVLDAVQSDANCASCHQALDPLASFFRSHIPRVLPYEADYPIATWYPELFSELLGVPLREPTYFGESLESGGELEALGRHIADDPRFALCTARRFWAYFNQVDADAVALDTVIELAEAFEAAEMSAKALTKAVVLAERFRLAYVEYVEPASGESLVEDDDLVALKKARPLQLASAIEDLTGFRWTADLSGVPVPALPYGLGHIDVMEDPMIGYHVLAGGIDALFVTKPAYSFGASSALVLAELARHAANAVVNHDLHSDGEPYLLTAVDSWTDDEDQIRAQLIALHDRLFAEQLVADDPRIDDSYTLWAAAAEAGTPTRAWKVVLTAMLQDVRIAYY